MLSFLRRLFGVPNQEDTTVHPELRRMLNRNSPLETLDSVIAKLDSDCLDDRRNAAYALGDYDTPIVTEKLLVLINDSDLFVQTYSIQSLGRRRATEGVLPLCELLSKNDSQDHRALQTLIDLLKSEDPFLRYDAAFALGEIGHRDAISHLELLLSDDTMPESFDADGGTTTPCSVGENAKKAIAKIRASNTAFRS